MIVASVESFAGRPRAGDVLMLMSRNPGVTSRLGQAVFLREEIDARTVHWLLPVRHGGLTRLMAKMTGMPFLTLRMDEGSHCSDVPAHQDTPGEACLVAIDSAAVDDLRAAATSRGLTLSRIGEFHRGPGRIDQRSGPLAADTIQAAFQASRRVWRETLPV
jgi:hypothetical protein